ncbi:MAG TPA: hypothetical protein VF384_02865 [Planctomycetota bacterium]
MSTDPSASHELTMGVTIRATRTFENVPVSYILLNKEDVDNKVGELGDVRQHQVASSVFPTVDAGDREYETHVTLPTEAAEAASYYIVAHVDPVNAIAEDNEDDNLPKDTTKVEVAVSAAHLHMPDIVMEFAVTQQEAVVLERTPPVCAPKTFVDPRQPNPQQQQAQESPNHDFDATLELTTTGGDPRQVRNTAVIFVPGWGAMPLQFWADESPQQRSYKDALLVTAEPGVATTVNMDVCFPAATREAIYQHLSQQGTNTFQVRFRTQLNSGQEWEDGVTRFANRATGSDNECDAEIVVVLPVVPGACDPLDWNAEYDKDWGGRTIGVGVEFTGDAHLGADGTRAGIVAGVPIKLFGLGTKAIDLQAHGEVDLAGWDAGVSVEFKMFGLTLFSQTLSDLSLDYERQEMIEKSYEASGRMFAGPVPLRLVIGASAMMGYAVDGEIHLTSLSVQGQAFGGVDVYASASADVVIFRAGVEGSLTLVDEVFTVRGGCALGYSGGHLNGTLTMDAINQLSGPSGRVYLFEEHMMPKWCWKVIPCGLRTVRNEFTVASFKTFTKTDVIFSGQRQFTICD